MARFNKGGHVVKAAVSLASSPFGTTLKTPTLRTHEGAVGWERTPQTELFLRASGAFHGGEGTFYESADKRDDRLRQLVVGVALEDPQWMVEFATWLRGPGNMRTASLMIAVDFVHARLAAGVAEPTDREIGLNRKIIDAVCQRPDEPGEILAIWTAWYGRRIPKPVKRGAAQAARRMYTERSLLKYDTATHAYRFGDVLNIVHAKPRAGEPWQGELFKYALDRRHNPATAQPGDWLKVVKKNAWLRSTGDLNNWLKADTVREAGMTWEDALSAVGSRTQKYRVWEALIPSMGIMGLIRNLRGFDEAGVSDEVAQRVIARLSDPDEIARSRQFPFRFLSAYRAVNSLRWSHALDRALNHSLVNVPRLGGRSLILVDRSPSMFPRYDNAFPASKIKGVSRADQAAVFGAALALRAEKPTLAWFGGESFEVAVPKGGSVLKLIDVFGENVGTDIPSAVQKHYAGHDRVIILTDEQTRPGYLPSNMQSYGGMRETTIDSLVPKDVPVYMWNFAGYKAAAMASGDGARFTMGGLTDASFRLIPQLEEGRDGKWPWEMEEERG